MTSRSTRKSKPITQAVILAGGLGERLRPLTQIIPKPLLPIGERSVLEIIIANMAKAGIDDIYLAVNYKFEMFRAYLGSGKKFGVKITYSKEKIPLGTAGPLKLLEGKLHDSVLITNGDILTNLDYRAICDYHAEIKSDLLIATKEFRTPLSYGVLTTNGARVTAMEEKPTLVNNINAGIYVMKTSLLRHIPANSSYSMNTLVQEAISAEYRVCHYLLNDYWLDIGQLGDYERAQTMALNGDVVF